MRGVSAPPKYVVRHSFWEWEQRAPVAESSYLNSSDSRSCSEKDRSFLAAEALRSVEQQTAALEEARAARLPAARRIAAGALEEGNLWIRASMPPTISLEAAMPSVTKMREILLSHPEVITVVSQHGRPDNGSDASGFFNAEFFVPLKPFDTWTPGMTKEKLVEDLQSEFAKEFAGIGFNFSQYIQDNIEEGLSGVKGANSVKIIGPDLAKLEKIAVRVKREMDQIAGVADLGIFRVLGQPNVNITVDRNRTARYGLNAGDVTTVVQAALGGTVATTQLEADRQLGAFSIRRKARKTGNIRGRRHTRRDAPPTGSSASRRDA
jgi:cobalt-zinc-cadmium resistance protein CzcA